MRNLPSILRDLCGRIARMVGMCIHTLCITPATSFQRLPASPPEFWPRTFSRLAAESCQPLVTNIRKKKEFVIVLLIEGEQDKAAMFAEFWKNDILTQGGDILKMLEIFVDMAQFGYFSSLYKLLAGLRMLLF